MYKKLKNFVKLPFFKKLLALKNYFLLIKTQIFYRSLCKSMGRKSSIRNPLYITFGYLSVGNNVTIWDNGRIEGVSAYAQNSYQPHIVIGNGVTIQQRCHITAASDLRIGNDTMIAFDVSIQDTDHQYTNLDIPIVKQPLIVQKTEIGKNCFIGSGVKIQAGTILGQHCVVGANSVIRGVFPDYSVIVGVPEKVIKQYNVETKMWEKTDKNEI